MKRALYLIVILFALVLTACDGPDELEPRQLSTPVDVKVDDGIIHWSIVENAEYYLVDMNSIVVQTSDTYYPISNIIKNDCDVAIKVNAKGDNVVYLDSPWSNVINYSYKVDSFDSNNDFSKYSLGTGINAITGTYLDFDGDTIKTNEFLDKKKLSSKYEVTTLDVKRAQLQTISENNISEFTKKFSHQYAHSTNVNLGLGVKGIGFTFSLSNKFSIRNDFEFKNNTNEYYYLSYQAIPNTRKSILNFDENQIRNGNFLSDYAISRLDAMNEKSGKDLTVEIINFFSRVGTHVITDAIYGGKIEVYYSIMTNENSIDENIETALNTSINATVEYAGQSAGAGSSTELDNKLKIGVSNKNTNVNFSANCIGGKGLNSNSFSSFASTYKDWIDDFNANKDNTTMIDIASGGLCPVWELLPEKYSSLKEKMIQIFNSELENVNDEFFSKFASNTSTEKGSTHYLDSKVLSCGLDNGYNYDKPDKNGSKPHYSHLFDFGKFVINNCAKSETEANTFSLCSGEKINVSFRLEYDSNNLPVQDTMTSRHVYSDGTFSNFYKLPWEVGKRKVGKGMIVALIEYEDGSPSDKICITNAFDKMKRGESVLIAESISKPCKISIAICYELEQWAPGFLGISDNYWMNWRINQTIIIK